MRPNNAFENGRSQASLRSLARAVQRGRYTAIKTMANGIFDALKPKRRCQTIPWKKRERNDTRF